MSRRKLVTQHVIRRTAEAELGRLWKVQEQAAIGDPDAKAELTELGITTQSKLAVRRERKRFYKFAVLAL